MNDYSHAPDAGDLLKDILAAQPNLLTPLAPNATTGEQLADFVEAFIRRYSGSSLRVTPEEAPFVE